MDSPHDRSLIRGEHDALLDHFEQCFPSAHEVWITVAFVMAPGVDLIRPFLEDLLTRGGTLRLITGDYFEVTEPRGLERLLDLASIKKGTLELRVFETKGHDGSLGFHPKAYLFLNKDPAQSVAFVGSSNLSLSALGRHGGTAGADIGGGVEWNYRIIGSSDARGLADIQAAYEDLAQHVRTRELTYDWVEAYRPRHEARRKQRTARAGDGAVADSGVGIASEELDKPTPHDIQKQALGALHDKRAAGHRAGLVVLATGLGKTWLAAFDSEAFAASMDKPAGDVRILFVAHVQEILDQARATFRLVWPDARLGLFTGKEKSPQAQVLFASIQTLGQSNHLESFAPDHFDYIIVDEFHHADARTYRNLIEYFTPGFLLGLTATPERTDGGDILALCGHNLVFRRDVSIAIEAGLLCPFRYYGVPDDVDYKAIPWKRGSGRFDEMELERALATQARAQNALDQWRALAIRPDSSARPRGLGFCCSIGHANYMAEFFTERGVPSVTVHSKPGSADRASSLLDLREGRIELIFTVDIFNEGVDVPNLDAVLMLRPTESKILWLQQFGRGLRKDPDNDSKVLSVIDYIGNHQVFRTKLQAMMTMVLATGEGNAELRRAFAALREGRAPEGQTLPPGCAISYELIPVSILDQLLPKVRSEEILREAYVEFRMQHGRRPTARELAANGALTSTTLKRSGYTSWFHFVAAMEDDGLGLTRSHLLTRHAEFFQLIETAPMQRSYKMLVLLAMLEEHALPGSLSVQRLATRFQQIVDRTPALQAELAETLQRAGHTLLALLRSEPLRAWAGIKRNRPSDFFTLEDDTFSARFSLSGPIPQQPTELVAESTMRITFAEMVHELVDWRLAEFLGRHSATPTPSHPAQAPDGDLTIGRAYMRADIPPFFGAEFNRSKWNQGIVSVDCGLVLLVTLDKANAQEAHRYKDRFTSPTHFTWQSQNQTTKTGKHGNLIKNHKALGQEIHLFVRKRPKLPNQTAASFYYCGRLDFQSWEGEKPITVEWQLRSQLSRPLAEMFRP